MAASARVGLLLLLSFGQSIIGATCDSRLICDLWHAVRGNRSGLAACYPFVFGAWHLETFREQHTDESVTEDHLLLLVFKRQHVAFRVQVVERIFRSGHFCRRLSS